MESRKPVNPKRKRKKRAKPELVQKTDEILQINSSVPVLPLTSDVIPPVVTKDVTLIISSQVTTPAIPEVTITPPEEDPNQNQEPYIPPETNILNQSVIRKKKKKKKTQGVIVAKDEVRPSPVLKYEPPSRRRSIVLQPTVSELEETCEDEVDCSVSSTPPTETKPKQDPLLVQSEINSETKPLSSSIGIDKQFKSIFETNLKGFCVGTHSILGTCELGIANSIDKDTIEEEELPSCIEKDIIVEEEISNCIDKYNTVEEKPPNILDENTNLEADSPNIVCKETSVEQANGNSVNQNIVIDDNLRKGDNKSEFNTVIVDRSVKSKLRKDSTSYENAVISEHSGIDNLKMKDIPVKKEAGQVKAEDQAKARSTIPNTCTKESDEVKPEGSTKSKAQLKAERKAAFEAQKGAQIAAQKSDATKKSKSQLKLERRALQESQRALKDPPKDETAQKAVPAPEVKTQKLPPIVDSTKSAVSNKTITISEPPFKKLVAKVPLDKNLGRKKMCLFSHLPEFQWNPSVTAELGLAGKSVHPAIIRAGLRMAQGLISGSDARCVATLAAFVEVINDYITPPQKELSRDLDAKLKIQIKFLSNCRPLSISMINAIKKLRWNITQIPTSMKDDDAKKELTDDIDTFIREEIILSKKAIADIAAYKIHNKDVILIYDCSPLVKQVLYEAHSRGTHFKVIVVDSRPGLGGREMLRHLVSKKIECSYVLINAVSYVMKEVNLVLLDCHSLQANGFVMSRMGSSQIALVAQACNVPVLVCCETYKFCERVHTDSFVDNELGNPQDLVTSTPTEKCHLQNWKDFPCLSLVNMTYDVTPADLVTSVITEIGMLPCTSVPVVLRVKHLSMPEPSK